jgi:hypothetical protein
VRDGGTVFAALSRDHIALEESFLYPEARARNRAGRSRGDGTRDGGAAARRATRRGERQVPVLIVRARR